MKRLKKSNRLFPMVRQYSLILLCGLLFLFCTGFQNSPVATILTIPPTEPQRQGESFEITVHLRSFEVQSIADQPVFILINGEFRAEIRTNSVGKATAEIIGDLDIGQHTVEAIYEGQKQGSRKLFLGSATKSMLTIEPALDTIIRLDSIPTQQEGRNVAIAGNLTTAFGDPVADGLVLVSVDGEQVRRLRTDEDGAFTFRTSRDLSLGTHSLHFLFEMTDELRTSETTTELLVEALPISTLLEIEAIPTLHLKEVFSLTVDLVTVENEPVSDAVVLFFIDDEQVRRKTTDHSGRIELVFPRNLEAGVHQLMIQFEGKQHIQGATASRQFEIVPPVETALTLQPIENAKIGERLTLTAQLSTIEDDGVAKAPIVLYIDGEQVRRTLTGKMGSVSFNLPRNLDVGDYPIRVEYEGSNLFQGSTISSQFTIEPPQETVLTLQPLPSRQRGEPVTVGAQLHTENGEPVTSELVLLYVGDEKIRQARTDESGIVLFDLPSTLTDGTHQITTVFKGSNILKQSNSSTELVIRPPVDTTLMIHPVPSVQLNDSISVTTQLLTTDGTPIANETIALFLNETKFRQIKTDEFGNAIFNIKRNLGVGDYNLKARFEGSRTRLGAEDTSQFTITSVPAEIHIIPPLANIQFSISYQNEKVMELESDESGIIQFPVSKVGIYHIELLTEHIETEEFQIEFDRWGTENYTPERNVYLPAKGPIEIGFSVSYRASYSFVNIEGNSVSLDQISSVMFKSSHGAAITFEEHGLQWFEANRVTRRRKGLEEVPIQYSLQKVIVEGTNVVNRNQQRYYAKKPNDHWEISLLFYPARFAAQDALFGFSVGTGIDLKYPDGHVVYYPFDENGEIYFESLPRGTYQVQAVGVSGIAPETPVAVSRFQDVKLLVLSHLDMGVFLAFGLLLATGLILFGRPYLLRYLQFRRGPTEKEETIAEPELIPSPSPILPMLEGPVYTDIDDAATKPVVLPYHEKIEPAKLIYVSGGNHLPKTLTVDISHPVRIGRNPGVCEQVIKDTRVSRLHAVISYGGNGFYIRDEGSSGGTFVNHHKLGITDSHLLQNNDIINFNEIEYRFQMKLPTGSEAVDESPLLEQFSPVYGESIKPSTNGYHKVPV